ncbi:hypothetical protein ACQPXH_28805 [Nocardia sp. CA-135953]|uniref:hypothetical protein n=1 Tax=Nocardia sp. CA-135953 TaxID=3239978 RepID=UPI003D9608E7
MAKLNHVLLVSVTVSTLTACTSSTDRADDQTCTGTFDFSAPYAEPLGSSKRFDAALRDVAKGSDEAMLIEITRAAGWTDDWERLVEVRISTEVADLNKNANTPGQCWKHLPTMDYREGSEQGYYLFVDKGKPVQVVSWSGNKKPLEVRDRGALTAESMLVPSQWHDKLEPAP